MRSVPDRHLDPAGNLAWWTFATAGRIAFGRGVARHLADALLPFGPRVLVITDANLVLAGVLAPVQEALSGADVLVYAEGRPEFGFGEVERCAAEVEGYAPDVVVGLGGGSNLDLAKLVASRLANGASWAPHRPGAAVPPLALPVVAVPTTAGTGSEVTSVAVLTDEELHRKVGISSPAFLPRAVLVDPLLTLSCPSQVTAHSGMDALTHAIEAFMAIEFADHAPVEFSSYGFVGKNPLSDVLAIRAIELIGSSIERAVSDGLDVDARERMCLASLFAGMAFSNAGTAIVHALQYPLGALTKTTHGHGNALLLPAATRFNLAVRPREAEAVMRALDAGRGGKGAVANQLPERLRQLGEAVGIAPGLGSIGVREEDLPAMAAAASQITRLTLNNPRSVDEAALLAILQDAMA